MTIVARLEGAIRDALTSDQEIQRTTVVVDPYARGRGTVRGAAMLEVQFQGLRADPPAGPSQPVQQRVTATVLVALAIQARLNDEEVGIEIMERVQGLISGLEPETAPEYAAIVPGFYRTSFEPLGRDETSGALIMASVYEVGLNYRQGRRSQHG